MKDAIYQIYGLVDPRTNQVRYVGKTKNRLSRRLREHIRSAKTGKIRDKGKQNWLDELELSNLCPVIQSLEICEPDNWRERETFWCSQFENLLNCQKPGGGSDGERLNELPEWAIQQLGKVSDSRIAEKLGVSRKAVSYYREQLGISASFDRTRNKLPPSMGGHNRIVIPDWVISKMGTMSDQKLADLFGCNKTQIMRARNKLGIPSYAQQTGNDGRIKCGEPHRRWNKVA